MQIAPLHTYYSFALTLRWQFSRWRAALARGCLVTNDAVSLEDLKTKISGEKTQGSRNAVLVTQRVKTISHDVRRASHIAQIVLYTQQTYCTS